MIIRTGVRIGIGVMPTVTGRVLAACGRLILRRPRPLSDVIIIIFVSVVIVSVIIISVIIVSVIPITIFTMIMILLFLSLSRSLSLVSFGRKFQPRNIASVPDKDSEYGINKVFCRTDKYKYKHKHKYKYK